jgi:hypothetical protein
MCAGGRGKPSNPDDQGSGRLRTRDRQIGGKAALLATRIRQRVEVNLASGRVVRGIDCVSSCGTDACNPPARSGLAGFGSYGRGDAFVVGVMWELGRSPLVEVREGL